MPLPPTAAACRDAPRMSPPPATASNGVVLLTTPDAHHQMASQLAQMERAVHQASSAACEAVARASSAYSEKRRLEAEQQHADLTAAAARDEWQTRAVELEARAEAFQAVAAGSQVASERAQIALVATSERLLEEARRRKEEEEGRMQADQLRQEEEERRVQTDLLSEAQRVEAEAQRAQAEACREEAVRAHAEADAQRGQRAEAERQMLEVTAEAEAHRVEAERQRAEAERAKTGAACAISAVEAALDLQRQVCAQVTLERRLLSESASEALSTESVRRAAAQHAAAEAQEVASEASQLVEQERAVAEALVAEARARVEKERAEAARRVRVEKAVAEAAKALAIKDREAALAAAYMSETVATQAAMAATHAAQADHKRRAIEGRLQCERQTMESKLQRERQTMELTIEQKLARQAEQMLAEHEHRLGVAEEAYHRDRSAFERDRSTFEQENTSMQRALAQERHRLLEQEQELGITEARFDRERGDLEQALAEQQSKLALERASLSSQLAEQELEMARVVQRFDDRVRVSSRGSAFPHPTPPCLRSLYANRSPPGSRFASALQVIEQRAHRLQYIPNSVPEAEAQQGEEQQARGRQLERVYAPAVALMQAPHAPQPQGPQSHAPQSQLHHSAVPTNGALNNAFTASSQPASACFAIDHIAEAEQPPLHPTIPSATASISAAAGTVVFHCGIPCGMSSTGDHSHPAHVQTPFAPSHASLLPPYNAAPCPAEAPAAAGVPAAVAVLAQAAALAPAASTRSGPMDLKERLDILEQHVFSMNQGVGSRGRALAPSAAPRSPPLHPPLPTGSYAYAHEPQLTPPLQLPQLPPLLLQQPQSSIQPQPPVDGPPGAPTSELRSIRREQLAVMQAERGIASANSATLRRPFHSLHALQPDSMFGGAMPSHHHPHSVPDTSVCKTVARTPTHLAPAYGSACSYAGGLDAGEVTVHVAEKPSLDPTPRPPNPFSPPSARLALCLSLFA